MSSQLHITNGDILTNKLNTLKLEGDIITWREMLCEGKTETNVGSESFWKTRFEFLNKNYKISKTWFIDKTLKEYRTLCNHKQEDRIVLWFDFDLFDQINMLAVISWLKTHRPYAEISLVSSEGEEDSLDILGLGELTDEQLRKLYTNRTLLTQDDIEYADYVWQLYCSDNPIRLENLKDFDSFQFSHLSGAIEAHLMRFPTIRNGLNEVENNILRLARSAKPKTKLELLNTVLRNQGRYGFGDTQYERVITKLKPLFTNLSPVKLSKKGMEILEGKTSYYSCIQENDAYLGGALKYNFLYNSETNRILKL
ncbi:uncharacterized protein DUF1835 [Arenibacter algicola]|uniref:Uncharacterized protein DUF1835 n=1 Tax=Arenibacter algicola TaxID=616991 RepID=A0A221V2N0_9FLAO|nr:MULTISPECIES: DUF1835 domain-containing protein [Arenibacter]ASO07862.1 hypothetical protein AREALGSMS7_04463 [Arenibacter algicola]GBF19264.1 hypothetical protein C21_01429 [Arenibacter sp. NBRC 103722]HCO82596.1 DUF1835 domain-containing protein [Arenibacter sp.]|tara:strand:+ start:33031 stop:33963 length:933 start_codon:yes stop_codon:yes gene_type:complete